MANNHDPWYVVRSKPRMEKYAAQTLENYLGLVVFAPQGKMITPQNEIKYVPFFPGYLFIQASPQKLQPQRINSCPGVLHLIAFDGELVSVPHTITETIHKKINDFNCENRLLNRPFQSHDQIRRKEESPKKLNMIFLNYETPEHRVRALLNVLGRLKEVQVDPCLPEKFPEEPLRKRVRFTRGRKRKTRLHSDFV
ncbi:transcription termination/antitermination protein NusG [Dictyobacter arantiisoli]|uniref:transcription termination/antitermination protein NusG n=1 Tax=Dictyobacter arantiisoli TaxID=2014874 RepID=UPI0011EDC4A6|nr:transcription termination/antitermination NusG family protein [Dictyobacter arantiisoli]